MQQVKIYTASPSDLSPPVQSESFCVDMVLASDYRELEAKCAAMVAENAELKSALNDILQPDAAVLERNHRVRALDAMETPATDEFLAEVRASARNEGINYAASLLAAAFNHGFLDKPVSGVIDVTRMILSAKEDLSNDPLPADDGLSGEYAEKAIEEWADQIRKGVQS
ncbi:hypothetical protein KW620_001887 [Salmonella enterica]|nr:hypothetical protein [Salmonella enterica]